MINGPPKHPLHHPPSGSQHLGLRGCRPENHKISSPPPRQQKSWKCIPIQTKIIRNGKCNHHETSKFYESSFLQYLFCRMLVLRPPSIQIQTQKTSEKETWKQAKHNTPLLVQGARKRFKMETRSPPQIENNRSVPQEWTQQVCQMISLGTCYTSGAINPFLALAPRSFFHGQNYMRARPHSGSLRYGFRILSSW